MGVCRLIEAAVYSLETKLSQSLKWCDQKTIMNPVCALVRLYCSRVYCGYGP